MTGNGSSSVLERPVAEVRTVARLVELARAGAIRVPPFQRAFRWDEGDVRALFDSLWRGFPIGSLLLWQRPALAERIHFESYAVEAPAVDDALWVVDGQHRLTALVATLVEHSGIDGRFELYFDLGARDFVRRRGRASPATDWLPLGVILDTNRLLEVLADLRDGGLAPDAISLAREFATRIGEYQIPLSIVKSQDEGDLRQIFHRLNSAGRRMTAAEVFRALHAALAPGDEGDLRTLIDRVGGAGFGSLPDDMVVRCVLAVHRGGDIYRSFENEFGPGEDKAAVFAETARTLERVFAFLRDDASIPHRHALPYIGVLPILARFFHLHPDPALRTRTLLRRWIWRGSTAWARDVGVLRRAVQEVTEDEHGSVDRLLTGLGAASPLALDPDAVQFNRASTRLNVALLASLRPLDLRDGKRIDVAALLDEQGPQALFEVAPAGEPKLANRLLHPAVDESELAGLMGTAREHPDRLVSHGVPSQAVDALLAGDHAGFVGARGTRLQQLLPEQRERLAEPSADDRPALSSLIVADP